MRDYLNMTFSKEVENENPNPPLKTVFFRFYDKKIMRGEINFLKMNMDKDAFISLSTAQDPEMSRDDIIDLCINMKLSVEEADEMMRAAGYEKING